METFSPEIGTVKSTAHPDEVVTKLKITLQAINSLNLNKKCGGINVHSETLGIIFY